MYTPRLFSTPVKITALQFFMVFSLLFAIVPPTQAKHYVSTQCGPCLVPLVIPINGKIAELHGTEAGLKEVKEEIKKLQSLLDDAEERHKEVFEELRAHIKIGTGVDKLGFDKVDPKYLRLSDFHKKNWELRRKLSQLINKSIDLEIKLKKKTKQYSAMQEREKSLQNQIIDLKSQLKQCEKQCIAKEKENQIKLGDASIIDKDSGSKYAASDKEKENQIKLGDASIIDKDSGPKYAASDKEKENQIKLGDAPIIDKDSGLKYGDTIKYDGIRKGISAQGISTGLGIYQAGIDNETGSGSGGTDVPGRITTDCAACQKDYVDKYNDTIREFKSLLATLSIAENGIKEIETQGDYVGPPSAPYISPVDPRGSVADIFFSKDKGKNKSMADYLAEVKKLQEKIDQARDSLKTIKIGLSACEARCAKAFLINVINLFGNNPYNRQNPVSEQSGENSGGGATVQVINNIPISRLTLAAVEAGCAYPHYHGNANNCNGVFTSDPAPSFCGQGIVPAVTSIPVSSCPDL